MYFYNEFTQDKSFGLFGFFISYVIRFFPVAIYTWDFLKTIKATELTGSHICEIFLASMIVIAGVWPGGHTIRQRNMDATFRHRDLLFQLLAFLYSGCYLALLVYVSSSPDL
jgi:hypothetical protein